MGQILEGFNKAEQEGIEAIERFMAEHQDCHADISDYEDFSDLAEIYMLLIQQYEDRIDLNNYNFFLVCQSTYLHASASAGVYDWAETMSTANETQRAQLHTLNDFLKALIYQYLKQGMHCAVYKEILDDMTYIDFEEDDDEDDYPPAVCVFDPDKLGIYGLMMAELKSYLSALFMDDSLLTFTFFEPGYQQPSEVDLFTVISQNGRLYIADSADQIQGNLLVPELDGISTFSDKHDKNGLYIL